MRPQDGASFNLSPKPQEQQEALVLRNAEARRHQVGVQAKWMPLPKPKKSDEGDLYFSCATCSTVVYSAEVI